MNETFREYYLPFIVLALFIGYQISLYFFYQFWKRRNQNLEFNKILIAFGTLFSFGLTGVAIRTFNSYYIEDPIISRFYIQFSHIIIAIAAISFLSVISMKTFDKVIPVKISRIFLFIAIVATIFILIIQSYLIQGIFILFSVITGGIYMIFFHVKFIKKCSGELKRRLIFIFVGELILIVSVLIRAQESLMFFGTDLRTIIELFTIPTLLFGLLMVLLGIIRFPVFLEFEWKNVLIDFYIINRDNQYIIFEYNFTRENREKHEKYNQFNYENKEIFLTKGLVGIEHIISSIKGKNEGNIKEINLGNYIILIQRGSYQSFPLDYIIIIEEDMSSVRFFLKSLKEKFEHIYFPTIDKLSSQPEQQEIVKGFKEIIIKQLNT